MTWPEKEALRLVAQHDGLSESELLRGYTIEEVVERAAQIQADETATS